jgi:hypothetical protein
MSDFYHRLWQTRFFFFFLLLFFFLGGEGEDWAVVYFNWFVLTNQLTPWRRVIIQKLAVPQLVSKVPALQEPVCCHYLLPDEATATPLL